MSCATAAVSALSVPDLVAVPHLLADGPSAELRRLVFGPRRFGPSGEDEANTDAWSPEELEDALAGVGFVVEELDSAAMIAVSARRRAVASRRAGEGAPPVCVLITSSGNSEALLAQLRALCKSDAGTDFETVVLVNGPDEGALAFAASLEGDVTIAPAR